jgi:hypothetical protein
MPPDGFSGGDRLRNYLADIGARVASASQVSIGFLEGATEADGASVAMIAAIQEFGAPKVGIPPRPFFRTMIRAKKGEWGDALAGLLKSNDYDSDRSLAQAGEAIAGQLRQSIVDTVAPPLSPVTLMLREMRHKDPDLRVTGRTVGEAAARVAAGEDFSGASTKPLVDSGTMLKSVDYEVT